MSPGSKMPLNIVSFFAFRSFLPDCTSQALRRKKKIPLHSRVKIAKHAQRRCGRYPGSCPSRPLDAAAQTERLAALRAAGVTTFVCLQQELPPQDGPWPDGGVPHPNPSSLDDAALAAGSFQNY